VLGLSSSAVLELQTLLDPQRTSCPHFFTKTVLAFNFILQKPAPFQLSGREGLWEGAGGGSVGGRVCGRGLGAGGSVGGRVGGREGRL
jgi:hypothetical protein